MIPLAWVRPVALVGLGLTAGILAGWALWRPKAAIVEGAAAGYTQKDGSKVLERKPDAAAKPAQELPKGAKLERVVQVKVQPRANIPTVGPETPTSGDLAIVGGPLQVRPCPPVTVDLSLVRMPDQTRRVIASSPDGEVVGGVDIPVESAKPAPKPLKWAAGGLWTPGDKTYGAWLQRNAGPFVIGAQVQQVRIPELGPKTYIKASVLVGIRF